MAVILGELDVVFQQLQVAADDAALPNRRHMTHACGGPCRSVDSRAAHTSTSPAPWFLFVLLSPRESEGEEPHVFAESLGADGEAERGAGLLTSTRLWVQLLRFRFTLNKVTPRQI